MPFINVGGIVYPSFNSTNGISLDLFISGCAREPHCENCHNHELWDFNAGVQISLDELFKIIKNKSIIDAVAVMGGEPLHNIYIRDILSGIRELNKQVWLYTSYDIFEIPENVLSLCDYIKTGRYMPEHKVNDGWLATSNQKIYRVDNYTFSPELYYEEKGAVEDRLLAIL
jgi:organic radical activating enzyme